MGYRNVFGVPAKWAYAAATNSVVQGSFKDFIDGLIYSPALRHPGGESHGESTIGGGRYWRSGSAEAPSLFSVGGGTFAASSCAGRPPVEKQRIPIAGARQHAEPCEFRVCGSEEHRGLVWASLGNGGSRVPGLRGRPDRSQSREWTSLRRAVA